VFEVPEELSLPAPIPIKLLVPEQLEVHCPQSCGDELIKRVQRKAIRRVMIERFNVLISRYLRKLSQKLQIL
jgi:hypothetical protein